MSCWDPAWYSPGLTWSLHSSGEETTNKWIANSFHIVIGGTEKNKAGKQRVADTLMVNGVRGGFSKETSDWGRLGGRQAGRELHRHMSKFKAWDGNAFGVFEERKGQWAGKKWGLSVLYIAWFRERGCGVRKRPWILESCSESKVYHHYVALWQQTNYFKSESQFPCSQNENNNKNLKRLR